MAVDLKQFKGLTPYASELFGIYQPLLGWKSKRKRQWIARGQSALLRSAVDQIGKLAPTRAALALNPRPLGPSDLMSHALDDWADSETGRALQGAAIDFVSRNKRMPDAADWKTITAAAGFDRVLARLAHPAAERPTPTPTPAPPPPTTGPTPRPTPLPPSEGPTRGVATNTVALKHEAAVAGALQHLAAVAPATLHEVLKLDKVAWPLVAAITDPLSNFDPTTERAILSPVGLINVFREYFFELDSFLGPAVGHVWVSPGGTLEVYEIHTRRTIEERSTEIGQSSMTRVDRESSETSELSDKVSEQNSQDVSLGISAEGGVNMGVYHASASASFDMKQNQQTAQETAHKQSRSQSEKVSNEIRREFKTTFKTTTDSTDTSSRRYILTNNTPKLVNYEMRRKMRRVGVQVQHIGTQLCWQLFVDDPGRALGIGVLVHAAAPDDLVSTPPPEAPPPLEPKKSNMVVNFAFEPLDAEARNDGEDEDYKDGFDVHEDPGTGKIRHKKKVNAPPPAQGYVLTSAAVTSYSGMDPNEDQPSKVATSCAVTGAEQFELTLKYVNFNDQPSINFNCELLWAPPEQSPEVKKAYDDAQKKYTEDTARAAHAAYVKEVRDRVEQASRVPKRDEDDLRAEERTVIFRRIMRDLTDVKGVDEPHLMSELIRSIFDVDKMLYYVAQEWWRPRKRSSQHLGEALQLTEADRVTWGGDREMGRANYLLTEDSAPAPLGASLGWLLQLDGDNHRNAFLNSPWVKAVLPIRPGREAAALNWLRLAHVEGTEGLDTPYAGKEPELAGKTIGDAVMALAQTVSSQDGRIENTLATETVYEKGFDPLEGGFRATGRPFEVFDQWIEVLPTDQVVAVEYTPPPVVPVP